MACRKMNEDVAYARNTESGCKPIASMDMHNRQPISFEIQLKTALMVALHIHCNVLHTISLNMNPKIS